MGAVQCKLGELPYTPLNCSRHPEPNIRKPFSNVRLLAPGNVKKWVGVQPGVPPAHLALKGLGHCKPHIREKIHDAGLTVPCVFKKLACSRESQLHTCFLAFLGAHEVAPGEWGAQSPPAGASMCTSWSPAAGAPPSILTHNRCVTDGMAGCVIWGLGHNIHQTLKFHLCKFVKSVSS